MSQHAVPSAPSGAASANSPAAGPVAGPVDDLAVMDVVITALATIFVIAALYAPQPLYPVLQETFGVGRATAALAVTLIMLPLAVAPIAYGILLESWPAARLARLATLIVGLGHFGLWLAPNWGLFLAVRLAQGLALPAALTGFMTLLVRASGPARVQRVLSLYIAATIVGGFSGRFFSGLMSHFLGWRTAFLIWGCCTLAAWLLLGRLSGASGSGGEKRIGKGRTEHGSKGYRPGGPGHHGLAQVREVLARPGALRAYMVPFCAFFAFTGVLNFLPFRMAELLGRVSELRVGIMYAGYLVGVATSLASARIVGLFATSRGPGEARAILLGLILFFASVAGCWWPHAWGLFAMLFPFCAGFFLVQSVGPGLVNRLGAGHEGLTNGLYIATYYAGGTAGSILPGLAYVAWGWNVFLGVVLAVLGVGILACAGMVWSSGKVASGRRA